MKEKRWFWSLNTLNTLPILNTPLIADCQQEDVCRGRGLAVSSSSSPSTPSSSSCSCQCDPEWPVFREDRQICVDSVHGNIECKALTLCFNIISTNFTKLFHQNYFNFRMWDGWLCDWIIFRENTFCVPASLWSTGLSKVSCFSYIFNIHNEIHFNHKV